MRHELSVETKQTFQIVALWATALVVAIHYRSAAPPTPLLADANWNELIQEFLAGGMARVAVPLFAFASGLFYFLCDDGSIRSYRRKLGRRCRTLLLPYFVAASVATASWLALQTLQPSGISVTWGDVFRLWWLHPPAEQLWFLRDLMLLVLVAPLIGMLVRYAPVPALAWFGGWWLLDFQPLPRLAGWYLLNNETLFFFALGCFAASRTGWLEQAGRRPWAEAASLAAAWGGLIAFRILLQPDFDIWYVRHTSVPALLVQRLSILVGCVAVYLAASHCRAAAWRRLSGFAFFVYLTHEFPLRAAAERAAAALVDPVWHFWILTPLALAVCLAAARFLETFSPSLLAVVTGGRTPASALRLTENGATPGNASLRPQEGR